MTADQVLASIDDTLAGYDGTISSHGDAMRWVPGYVICDGGKPLRIGLMVNGILMVPPDFVALNRAFGRFGVAMTAKMQSLIRVMQGLTVVIRGTWYDEACNLYDHPRRHIHCRTCNPDGNPLPLAIDGREYRRRQLARKRKRK